MIRLIAAFFSLLFLLCIVSTGGGFYILWHFGRGLPDYLQLADYEPDVTSRFYAGDGLLLAEYATEKRFFVPYNAIPDRLTKAFLSAEDKSFMHHHGIDFKGIVRAVLTNIKNYGKGRRMISASTITQQVAKNFLLTNEISIERKIKEAILAFRIERTFNKERILELYLNEIYLGFRSYGIVIASMNYFNKSLDELTLAETAFLAALPKAPNNYDPKKHYEAAITRRNWVLRRMEEDGVISKEEAEEAKEEEIILRKRDKTEMVQDAEYFTEEVRREIKDKYGEDSLYKGGLAVRTTVDARLQKAAVDSLRKGLISYDRNCGWRGAAATISVEENWVETLQEVAIPAEMDKNWELSVVLALDDNAAIIGFADKSEGLILLKRMKWARKNEENQKVSKDKISKPSDVLSVGDVIAVELIDKTKKEEPSPLDEYHLRQIPNVDGAIVAIDPHTGRILAMTGGFSYKRSQFNRAVQAMRQPGSAFKPFVYLAALDEGYTPSTLILDAPFVYDQGPGKPKWKPRNYSNIFYGPTTLRIGIEKSRNLMTVRLAQAIGMEKISEYSERFKITERLPQVLSMSLGAGETTVLKLTTAYAMLVNGGKRITPTLIDRIQDRNGKTIYRHDNRPCVDCHVDFWANQSAPNIPDLREQIVNPLSAYQMVSILEGVVKRGTGRTVKSAGKTLAGKTGTTNENVDAWFVGFSPDLAVGVFVGFDSPRTLGSKQTGGRVAAPIFRDFMKKALKDAAKIPFRMPSGIRLVRINSKTGKPAKTGDTNVIVEAFKPDTETSEKVIGDDVSVPDNNNVPEVGGFY